jgi:hypothetical protein
MNKGKITSLLLVLFFTINRLLAQDVTTVNALNDEIGDHLDLEAVASIFGDAKDLEDFEKRLNDPKSQISNLDLNEDNNVDYLRVVETAENDTHVIAIQAVLGEDLFQDVATLEVEKDSEGKASVQVVGDVYMYGPNYIIEPVYVYRPVLFSLFWRPFYRPYRSVFYWGYYPRHFHFWHPHHIHTYRKSVHVHINVRHSYSHTHVRRSATAVHIHSKTRRNDFAKNHPNKSYTASVAGVNKTNGTKKRALQVKQPDGDTFRVAGVNKSDGTKKRAAGVNQADGDKFRTTGVNKPNGTKKRFAGANKADGSKKVVTVKKKPKTKKNYKPKTRKGNSKGKKGAKEAKGKAGKSKKARKKKKH